MGVLTTLRRLAASASVAALAIGLAVTAAAPAQAAEPARISAANGLDSAAALAAKYGPANAVIIANGDAAKDGVDALAANYLAGTVGAPIILTSAAGLRPAALAVVKATLAGAAAPKVFVIGKTDSVSAAALAQVTSAVPHATTSRIAGNDRYETAAAIVKAAPPRRNAVASGSASALPTAILASGEVNADALAAGPLSAAWGIPVILTQRSGLPAASAAALKTAGIRQLIVLGGTDRVPAGVLGQAKTAGAAATVRVAGPNRFATSARLYDLATTTLTDSEGDTFGTAGADTFVTNGLTGFAETIAAGPIAGKAGSPLVTVSSRGVDPEVSKFLVKTGGGVTVVGSISQIPSAVAGAAAAAAAGQGPATPPAAPAIPSASGTASAGEDSSGSGTPQSRYLLRTELTDVPVDTQPTFDAGNLLPAGTAIAVTGHAGLDESVYRQMYQGAEKVGDASIIAINTVIPFAATLSVVGSRDSSYTTVTETGASSDTYAAVEDVAKPAGQRTYETAALRSGQTRLGPGNDGKTLVTYRQDYVDGEPAGDPVNVDSVMLVEPLHDVLLVGTDTGAAEWHTYPDASCTIITDSGVKNGDTIYRLDDHADFGSQAVTEKTSYARNSVSYDTACADDPNMQLGTVTATVPDESSQVVYSIVTDGVRPPQAAYDEAAGQENYWVYDQALSERLAQEVHDARVANFTGDGTADVTFTAANTYQRGTGVVDAQGFDAPDGVPATLRSWGSFTARTAASGWVENTAQLSELVNAQYTDGTCGFWYLVNATAGADGATYAACTMSTP